MAGLTKGYRGLNTQALARMLHVGELPESAIRELPAQSLYMALKHNGISASPDVIELGTDTQCKLMLDMDLWQRDRFYEENLWEWLAASDETNQLAALQKILRVIDLKLVALLISRHVNFIQFDDPTENPPGPGHYTPDKGHTWINIHTEDADKHFLLGRFLALVFETSADLFYKLLALSEVETESNLEEVAYQDKEKRLSSESIPDLAFAHEINAPAHEAQIRALLEAAEPHSRAKDLPIVEPLIYEGHVLQPLHTFFDALGRSDAIEGELTLLVNAALVRFSVEFYNHEQVFETIRKVRGALNIGLEVAQTLGERSFQDLYHSLALKKIYALGLERLYKLRAEAQKIHLDEERADQTWLIALEAAKADFPCMPDFLQSDGTIASDHGKVSPKLRSIEHVAEIECIRKFLLTGAAATF